MAETPPAVKVTERLTDVNTYKKWAIYVLITVGVILIPVGGVSLWRWIFPGEDKQVNNPKVTVLPGGRVGKIDQTNTQIDLSEKPWEVGCGVGGFRYDSKDGYGGMVWLKRKW